MDYAKHGKQPESTKRRVPGWVWFLTGLVTGVFGSFLFYLDYYPGTKSAAPEDRPVARVVKPQEIANDIKLDFYEIFPNFEVPVEEYSDNNKKIPVERSSIYVLQVGSFQKPEDADSVRARLILLGLDAYVKKVEVKGQYWHRVLVGPLKSDLALNRAQDTIAEAGLKAIPLQVQM